MSNRTIRVGELLLRELSLVLHSKWRSESVGITLTSADVSSDLRNARIFYSAIGGREGMANAGRFLAKNKRELKSLMMKNITLKYTPDLEFVYDYSFERGSRVMDIIEELEHIEQAEQTAQDSSKSSSENSEIDDMDEDEAKSASNERKSKKSGAYNRNKLKRQDDSIEY